MVRQHGRSIHENAERFNAGSAAEELSDQAEQLHNLVGKFILRQYAAGGAGTGGAAPQTEALPPPHA
ncbi:MAG: hypothetical protein ACOC6J_06215 [Spirochaetota bacterium]